MSRDSFFSAYGGSGGTGRNPGSLAASLGLHAAGVAALLLFAPRAVLESVMFIPRETVLVVPARPQPAQLAARPKMQVHLPPPKMNAKLFLPPAPVVAESVRPQIKAPPALPPPEAPPMPANLAPPPAITPAAPPVRVNTFSQAAVAMPPVSVPQRTKSAGFDQQAKITLPATPAGNPVSNSGFDAAAGPSVPVQRASAVRTGAFGQVSGAARPVQRGAKARTGGAGFDQQVETARAALPARLVRQGGFDQPQAAAPVAAARPLPAAGPVRGVEVLDKPKPAYTQEARRLKIEGTVLLDVVFAASGELRVLGVIRGLGHGLDENAVEAARRIRFKPAARAGTPIDQRATLHVIFQMTG